MKKVSYLLVAASLALVTISCGNKAKNQVDGADAQTVATGNGARLVVDSAHSVIEWEGSKVGGTHHGVLALNGGELTVSETALLAGNFTIDMTSLHNLDQTVEAMSQMLDGHLKNADFFDVEKYPLAKFEVTASEAVAGNDSVNYKISGNLTLKGATKNVTFGAKVVKEGEVYTATSERFAIDRTQWGVTYASKSIFADLKENIVSDIIQLKIKVVARVAK